VTSSLPSLMLYSLHFFFCFEGLLHVCGHEGPYHDQRLGVLVLIGNPDSSTVCQSGREP
jgi:hypothetical protein